MKTRGDDFDWSFDMVLIWARYLTKKKITEAEFKLAEENSFDGDWMPNNAQEFLALARRNSKPLYPTANDAFITACSNCGMKGDVKRKWGHVVVYETANRIGWGRLASASEYFLKTFTATYEQVCSEHKGGSDFVIPEDRQLTYEHTPVRAGTAASANIDAFLRKFGSKAV